MIFLLLLALAVWAAVFIYIDHFISAPHMGDFYDDSIFQDSVAVLVVGRNEALNLKHCFSAISNSKGFARPVQLHYVDDHSTDSSVQVIRELQVELPQLEISFYTNEGKGKKKAIAQVLSKIEADWIFFTDADCEINQFHLKRMISIAKAHDVATVFGPVSFIGKSFFSRLMQYENLNTQCVTEAFLGRGKPLMANAANMLISNEMKDRYLQSQRFEFPSGDDVFYAQSLSTNEYSWRYQTDAMVKTTGPESIQAFFHQRLRWVSKMTAYRSIEHVAFSFSVGFVSLVSSFVFIRVFGGQSFLNTWFLFLIVKWLIEFNSHRVWFRKYNFNPRFVESLIMAVFYPFYILLFGVLALLPIKYRWKGRSLTAKTVS
ncbi:MAG: glycosyltransferase [Salibacteraceae bacterium]